MSQQKPDLTSCLSQADSATRYELRLHREKKSSTNHVKLFSCSVKFWPLNHCWCFRSTVTRRRRHSGTFRTCDGDVRESGSPALVWNVSSDSSHWGWTCLCCVRLSRKISAFELNSERDSRQQHQLIRFFLDAYVLFLSLCLNLECFFFSFLFGRWSYLFILSFLFCVNIFILMWSEYFDCKCVYRCVWNVLQIVMYLSGIMGGSHFLYT